MKMQASNKAAFRKLPLVVAMLGCLYGTQAMAQDAPAQGGNDQAKEESKKDETKTLEKITVTGSLLKRLEYDTTSPVQVLTADTSVDAGQINTAEFLQKSSVAAGSTQISNQSPASSSKAAPACRPSTCAASVPSAPRCC